MTPNKYDSSVKLDLRPLIIFSVCNAKYPKHSGRASEGLYTLSVHSHNAFNGSIENKLWMFYQQMSDGKVTRVLKVMFEGVLASVRVSVNNNINICNTDTTCYKSITFLLLQFRTCKKIK